MATFRHDWSPPPQEPELSQGQVHVWRFRLDPLAAEDVQVLSPDEHERARRFRSSLDRNRFVAGRLTLRRILAGYLGCDPAQIHFTYSAHRRPALHQPNLPGLDFNLTHSHDRALLAVGLDLGIGIDLERIAPDRVDEGLLQLACSGAELNELSRLSQSQRATRFYRCWTRKEACLKARGDGLAASLSDITVLSAKGDPLVSVASLADGNRPDTWCLTDLAAWPGFAAALAWTAPQGTPVDTPNLALRLWDWRGSA